MCLGLCSYLGRLSCLETTQAQTDRNTQMFPDKCAGPEAHEISLDSWLIHVLMTFLKVPSVGFPFTPDLKFHRLAQQECTLSSVLDSVSLGLQTLHKTKAALSLPALLAFSLWSTPGSNLHQSTYRAFFLLPPWQSRLGLFFKVYLNVISFAFFDDSPTTDNFFLV